MEEMQPVSGEPSPKNDRGDLHRGDMGRRESSSPQTLVGTGSAEARCITVHRVLRLKLENQKKEIWKLLRAVAAECASYANHVLDAAWMHARGYRPPEDGTNPSRDIRARFAGRLSGSVYSAMERKAQAAWKKAARRSLTGWQGLPIFEANRSIAVRWDGVKVERLGDNRYALRVTLLKKGEGTPEDHRKVLLPIVKNTARERYQKEMIERFVSGEVKVDHLELVFSPKRGRVMAHLSYKWNLLLPPMGDRVATFGPIDPDRDRVTLRADGMLTRDGHAQPLDFTGQLQHVRRMKDQYEQRARRMRWKVGRSRRKARTLRRKLTQRERARETRLKDLEAGGFTGWCKRYCDAWSRKIIDWCGGAGVGKLVVLPIGDGDWPAYQFVNMLKYKGKEVGIEVVEQSKEEADLAKDSTYRALSGEIKKQQRGAAKARKAFRTLQSELNRKG